MEAPFSIEMKAWKNLVAKNNEELNNAIDDLAVIVKDGYKFTKKTIIEATTAYKFLGFSIDSLEVVLSEESSFQSTYVAKIKVEMPSGQKCKVEYRVTDTWKEVDEVPKLVFSMIQTCM